MAWSFDGTKAQMYVNQALANNAQYLNNQLNYAAMELRHKRETDDPQDKNRELAAAEHYMYARWQVASGETSEAVMRVNVLGYDALKLADYVPLVPTIRRLAGHSWTRPSVDSIRWGLKGCHDGAVDLHRITPDPSVKPFGAGQ